MNLLNSENRFEYKQEYDPNDINALMEAPFPEYLAVEDKSADMAQHLVRWLSSDVALREATNLLEPLRKSFAKPGASTAAASYIMQQLTNEPLAPTYVPNKKVA